MKMPSFPVPSYPMLLLAGTLLAATPAVSAAFDLGECGIPCTTRYRACFEQAKDSPNDIDRELCENERKSCFAACDEASAEFQKQEVERHRLEQEERERLGIVDTRTSEERNEDSEEQLEREAREKQERLDKAAREEQERQEKAAEERKMEETLNGTIPIYQFK